MIRRRFFIFLVAPIILLWATFSYATTIIPATLEYMTDFSGTIIIGHVSDQYSYKEDEKIFTNIVIEVERFVKNRQGERASSIQLKIPGGKVEDIAFELDGAPIFTPGEKVLLFLKKTDEVYFPYGLNYGVYKIFSDEGEGKEFINGPLFNHSMHYNISTMQAVRNTEALGKKEFIPFLERVEKLVK